MLTVTFAIGDFNFRHSDLGSLPEHADDFTSAGLPRRKTGILMRNFRPFIVVIHPLERRLLGPRPALVCHHSLPHRPDASLSPPQIVTRILNMNHELADLFLSFAEFFVTGN